MASNVRHLHAIQTNYASTKFRSRLEAKWAVFFDLVGWRWEYEPLDLTGWIPDFALIGKNETVFVEVKPIDKLESPIAKAACAKAERAVLASGHDNEILLLGFLWPETGYDEFAVGWLCEWCPIFNGLETASSWDFAPFHLLGGWGFHHKTNSFRNRMTGEYDGTLGTEAVAPIDLWREAGNMVQWRSSLR